MLPKFNMAARGQLQTFCGRENKKKLSEIIQILQDFTFPTICTCAGDFFKTVLKFKMAALNEPHNFLLVQKLKNLSQK